MVAEAARRGLTVIEREWSPHVYDRGGWIDDDERAALLAYFHDCLATIENAGRHGRDVAAEGVLDRCARWYPLLSHWIAAISGVDADVCSARAWAEDDDTGENWPTREGYGTLIARVGAGLPIVRRARVVAVDTTGFGVRVTTSSGTIDARAAVVTVSTGVLAADAIRFTPRLPDWKLEAIDAVPMGVAEKIALSFDRDVFGLGENGYAIHAEPAPQTIGFQIFPAGDPIVIGYVAGRHAASLTAAGEAAAVECALEQLGSMFGSRVRAALARTAVTSWGEDPLFRGAFSSARPGRTHLRAKLAESIDERLFFAGEATSPRAFSTAHGAHESGVRAANAVLAALRRSR